jgi:Flp pilus assembly protein TadD/mono/diheme cytochrome c family protein
MRWVLFAPALLWFAGAGHDRLSFAGPSNASARQGVQAAQGDVTFTRDVAPIVFEKCVTCHRPSGSAPFSLLTYDEVRGRATQIAAAVERRAMPPWPPEPGHGEFTGNRRLSDVQIATVKRWVEGGAIEGDPALLPPRPTASGRWQLGEPDLVLQTGVYTLRATGDDMYRNFVLSIPGGETRYVRAWEFLPGNTRVVHHATMQFDAAGTSRELDALDPEPGYEGLIPHSVASPDGFFLDWGPGHSPYVAPDGMAWPLRQGTDLVMMLHLRPSGRVETLQGTLGLYFSKEPPTRAPTLVRLTRQNLDIPAGQARYPVIDSVTLPVDVDVYTVQPHAHYLAREVKGFANLPDGTQRALIYIRDWNFDWQGVYRYTSPVRLPAGTTIRMEYVYDNSASNPRNPHSPPRRVSYGQRTTDEMAELWFQVVTRTAADRQALTSHMQAHVFREEIVGHEKMLEADPRNTALHNGVALLHAAVGNLGGAATHFAAALKENPESPSAHYNVGMALLLQGRHEEAGGYFVKAVALDPDYAQGHDGLGQVRQRQGNTSEALRHFREAVRLAPANADARRHLADLERELARQANEG